MQRSLWIRELEVILHLFPQIDLKVIIPSEEIIQDPLDFSGKNMRELRKLGGGSYRVGAGYLL